MKRELQSELRQWGAELTGPPSEIQLGKLARIIITAINQEVSKPPREAVVGVPEWMEQLVLGYVEDLVDDEQRANVNVDLLLERARETMVACEVFEWHVGTHARLLSDATFVAKGIDSCWPTKAQAEARAKVIGENAYVYRRPE